MIKKILFLTIISFSFSMHSLNLEKLGNFLKKDKQVDTANIKLDFNKGIDLNFITQDPNKGRISEHFIGEPGITEIKQKSKDFIPSELTGKDFAVIETTKGVIRIKLFEKEPGLLFDLTTIFL